MKAHPSIPPAVLRARGNAGVLPSFFPTALALLLALLPPAARAFTASDASTNAPYDSGYWSIGDNGGSGFGEWRQVGSSATPNLSIDQGFAIYANAGVGEGAVGRSFDDGGTSVSLSAGTFSVDAQHGFADAFSGFALCAAGDAELLRWGVTTTENHETGAPAIGFWYAPLAGGSPDYVLLATAPVADIVNAQIAYSVTWSLVETGLSVDLSIDSDSLSDTFHLTLDTTSPVDSVAALLSGTSQSAPFHFDNLLITGPSVPEPSTLALLLLGTLALPPLRRK